MKRIAFLFPGQGSQAAGMGSDLSSHFPDARAVFNEADRILGFALSRVCFEGRDEDLKPTEMAQPALLTCSVAALRCVEARGVSAAAVAGHSLGEYSALVAARVLSFEDALRLVQRRSALMALSAREKPGAMAALLGLNADQAIELCKSVQQEDGLVVVAANLNAPGQVVISGTPEGVKAASERAKAAGASRAIPLAVSGAFHSPLMTDAGRQMEAQLKKASMEPAWAPVVQNTTAEAVVDKEAIRSALASQICSGVRWEESVRALDRMGITHYLEIGPGKVLCGLVRKILPGARTHSVADSQGMDGLEAFLAGEE